MTTAKYPKTDITIILDRSGSMAPNQLATIDAYNKFLNEQKLLVKKAANLTLVQFDHEYGPVTTSLVAKAMPLTTETYRPRGNTALLDAIGSTIEETKKRFAAMNNRARPNRVLFIIMTDGYENWSKRYTKEQIKGMIQAEKGWEWVFLGANVDAFTEAQGLGITLSSSYYATPKGLGATLNTISQNAAQYANGTIANAQSVSWDPTKSGVSITP